MIVERTFYHTKLGCGSQLIKLCQQVTPWWKERQITTRAYDAIFGPYNVICVESEFDSLAECERIDKEWDSSPELAAIIDQWRALCEPGGGSEIWELYK